MFRLLAVLLLLPIFTASGPAVAQGLYQGVVPVSGQDDTERRQAAPDALIQVLQKLSGQRELVITPEFENGLRDAERMMVSFQYIDFERVAADGSTSSQLRLVASFNPEAVDQLVREMALPRWRTERQPIVVWVVVDDGRGRKLQPVEYQYAWDTLEDMAGMRGLTMAWPELSEELMDQVDLQLLWGGYADQLISAGSNSDGVVIAAARREGPEWNVRWTYSDTQASSSWRTRDRELSFAMVEGLHRLTDLVASVNSIGTAGLGEWQVELLVADLGDHEDFDRCLAYLQNLSLVDKVGVLQAGPSGIRFRLDLNAEPEYLKTSLEREGVLASIENASSENEFEYRLLP